MNKQPTKAIPQKEGEKSIFRRAGEMIGNIGSQIADGSDKLVGAVADEISIVKKVIKKKLAVSKPPRKSSKKKSSEGVRKKTVRKTKNVARKVKKRAKEINPVKTLTKSDGKVSTNGKGKTSNSAKKAQNAS